MVKVPKSRVQPGHPDYDLLTALSDEVLRLIPQRLDQVLANGTLEAVEFVLDPLRTGRTTLSDLDNVEKTFVGLKVEHFIRDVLDAPKGVRDLVLLRHDVDVKNTVGHRWCWMIPPETYKDEDPCLLIALNEQERRAWMGLIVARKEYLGAKNRDAKRRVYAKAFSNILWLSEGVPWPANRWAGIDMARFRELRKWGAGPERAAAFFRENLRKPIHRRVTLALLHDQKDPMKRLRANGGAPDHLRSENIALLSGRYRNDLIEALGFERISNEEHIAVDAKTSKEATLLRDAGEID